MASATCARDGDNDINSSQRQSAAPVGSRRESCDDDDDDSPFRCSTAAADGAYLVELGRRRASAKRCETYHHPSLTDASRKVDQNPEGADDENFVPNLRRRPFFFDFSFSSSGENE